MIKIKGFWGELGQNSADPPTDPKGQGLDIPSGNYLIF